MRLAQGTLLAVRGQPATVVARRVGQGRDGPVVIYDCTCDEAGCQLRVELSQGRQGPLVRWSAHGSQAWLAADDVECFG